MKKILSILIIFSLLLSSLTVGMTVSAASDNATLSVESIEAAPGETVTVDITISGNPGILGMTLKVTYDEDILTLTSVVSGDAMSALTFTPPKSLASGCMLPFDALEIYEKDIKDGTVATLTFDISENATAGSVSKISLSYNNGAIIDNNLIPLDIELVEGSVTIDPPVHIGDVNGDGRVNAKDGIKLKAFISGNADISTIVLANADIDGNNRINALDTIKFKKLLA